VNMQQRPDQAVSPPPMVVSAGGSAGVFRGRLIIVNGATPPGSGIFIYDGSGNLIGYWIGIPGTDPIHGSTLSNPGITVQNTTNGTISGNLQADGLIFEKTSGILAPPTISVADNTVANATTTIDSTVITTLLINTYQINTTNTVETWHNISLANGWTGTARYQYNPVGSAGRVYINLQLDSTSATAQAINTAAIAAPYRPATTQFIAAGSGNNVATGTTAGNASAFVQITSGGILTVAPLHAFSTAGTWICNGSYPLD